MFFFVIHSSLAGTERIKVNNVWKMNQHFYFMHCFCYWNRSPQNKVTRSYKYQPRMLSHTIYIINHVYIHMIAIHIFLLLLEKLSYNSVLFLKFSTQKNIELDNGVVMWKSCGCKWGLWCHANIQWLIHCYGPHRILVRLKMKFCTDHCGLVSFARYSQTFIMTNT